MNDTSNQVNKFVPNPTGKGGFIDHPENRSDGRWSKENSFKYWLNYFKNMNVEDFMKWEQDTPAKERSTAASLAYARVANARLDYREFVIVADRTEGKPVQAVDVTTLGEKIDGGHNALKEIAEAIRHANRDKEPDEPAPSTDGLADITPAS